MASKDKPLERNWTEEPWLRSSLRRAGVEGKGPLEENMKKEQRKLFGNGHSGHVVGRN